MIIYNIDNQQEVIELNRPFLINGDIEIVVFDDYNEFNAYIENKYPQSVVD